jgi:hypothetical protein
MQEGMYTCNASRRAESFFVKFYVPAAGEPCYNMSTRVKFGSNPIIN